MKKYIVFILMGILILSACDDLFTPANELFKDIPDMYREPDFAKGFLVNAYSKMPNCYDNSEYATDDAVTNQKSNAFLRAATGSWTASNNPFNRWDDGFNVILYINLFLEHVDHVTLERNEIVEELTRMRMKGEAYGMRAYHMYYLLRAHAGITADGKLMGIPLILDFLENEADFDIPRDTFEDCLKQIHSDLDKAEALLPMEYGDIDLENGIIPAPFDEITADRAIYNRVMGYSARQLCDGLIVRAIRSKVTLLAASPAFQDATNPTTWADAANAAASVIDYAGGIGGLDPKGNIYYIHPDINSLTNASNPKEIIWRTNLEGKSSTQEAQNYPPSLFGTGYMNPTQNLVDAFPMANGYPIKENGSGYNDQNPYAGRDPRLSHYIIYNGSTAGVDGKEILTGSRLGTDDGINVKETSTRTGYYMKKRLNMQVNRNPASINEQTHYTPRIRYTEIYLNYAEAANEAWGPTGTGGHAYSAYDIIKAIRQRAGVGLDNGDAYLESIKNDPDKMRELIRNERRLELCFEGFRFWDMRRWKMDLNETARGMDVSNTSYTIFDVENRSFSDHMYYGPIPYSETLKYGSIIQNKGW